MEGALMGRTRNPQTNSKPTPRRKPARFRESEVARAVRAAKQAGASTVEVDPASGKITVIVGGKPDETTRGNPWDEVLNKDASNQKRPA
jgi:hypothetical protein